jgi:hypothetical protein
MTAPVSLLGKTVLGKIILHLSHAEPLRAQRKKIGENLAPLRLGVRPGCVRYHFAQYTYWVKPFVSLKREFHQWVPVDCQNSPNRDWQRCNLY